MSAQALSRLYTMAVEIFTSSIYPKTADFPVNLDSKIRTTLETMFVAALPEVTFNKESAVDPFNYQSTGVQLSKYPVIGIHIPTGDTKGASESQELIIPSGRHPVLKASSSKVPQPTADMPSGFDEHIFDDAEHSIKYMVITNTWLRFVDSIKDIGAGVNTIQE